MCEGRNMHTQPPPAKQPENSHTDIYSMSSTLGFNIPTIQNIQTNKQLKIYVKINNPNKMINLIYKQTLFTKKINNQIKEKGKDKH